MDRSPEPISVGRQWSRVARRKRIVLGAVLLASGSLAIGLCRWEFDAGGWIYGLLAFFILYLVLLIFRAEWVARFEKKEEEKLTNWRGDPRKFTP